MGQFSFVYANQINSFCPGIYMSTEKICDAVELAGSNVLQTSSVVTTGLASHRYQLIY